MMNRLVHGRAAEAVRTTTRTTTAQMTVMTSPGLQKADCQAAERGQLRYGTARDPGGAVVHLHGQVIEHVGVVAVVAGVGSLAGIRTTPGLAVDDDDFLGQHPERPGSAVQTADFP